MTKHIALPAKPPKVGEPHDVQIDGVPVEKARCSW
jgi:hypothetical protein